MSSKTICFITTSNTPKYCYKVVFLFESFLVLTVYYHGIYIYIESDFLISDVWRRGMLNTKSVWTIYQTGGSEGGRGEEREGYYD